MSPTIDASFSIHNLSTRLIQYNRDSPPSLRVQQGQRSSSPLPLAPGTLAVTPVLSSTGFLNRLPYRLNGHLCCPWVIRRCLVCPPNCSFSSCVPLKRKLLESSSGTLTFISMPFEGLQVTLSYLIFILIPTLWSGQDRFFQPEFKDEKTEAQRDRETCLIPQH